MKARTSIILLVLPLMLAGCSSNGKSSGSSTIGPEGGTVTVGGSSVVIPAGALSGATDISVEENPSGYPEIPSSIEAHGSVWAFLPHGLVFASPVTVTVPFTGSATDGLQLFTASPGGSWAAVEGATIEGNAMRASVEHFSYYVVGEEAFVPNYSCACQSPPDTDGGYTCLELFDGAAQCEMLDSQCSEGGSTILDHCPSGFSGRCTYGPGTDGRIEIHNIYNISDTTGILQSTCEAGDGVWEG
jgi:hypothetical protein